MKKLTLLLCAIALVSACSNDDTPPAPISPEYAVFGLFSGGMSTEDFNMYRVTRTRFEREVLSPPFDQSGYAFESDEALSAAELSNAQQVLDLIPEVLIAGETTTYGCPDCHDQGGYYLEFGEGNRTKRVLIDLTDTADQPVEVVQFKNALATLVLLFDN